MASVLVLLFLYGYLYSLRASQCGQFSEEIRVSSIVLSSTQFVHVPTNVKGPRHFRYMKIQSNVLLFGGLHRRSSSVILLLLLLSGDVELNPGPSDDKNVMQKAAKPARSALSESTSTFLLPKPSPNRPRKSVICTICCETVEDATGRKKGHDAIFCDGECQEWIHSQCAGLSKAKLKVVSSSTDPFYCPRCCLSRQSKEIEVLKQKLNIVTEELSRLNDRISSLSQPGSRPCNQLPDRTYDCSKSPIPETSTNQSHGTQISARPSTTSDKKYNLVFHGISESPTGTPFRLRLDKDHDAIFSSIESLGCNLTPATVRDCIRLGKYRGSNQRPRPILVKLNSSKAVTTIISNSAQLRPNIFVKRDLTKEERHVNSILLKERHRLVTEQGIDKTTIRFRGCRLFINNRPYGEAGTEGFVTFPSLGHLAPSLENVSTNSTQSLNPSPPSPSANHKE